jgi:hypothetical protein
VTTPGPLNANYVSLAEPFVDIRKDFHAYGDGVSDDSAAINAAISAASTNFGAGTVYFPPGTYLCKSTITLLSQVHLRGSGIEATIIKLANAANTDLMSANTASINLAAGFGTGSAGGVFNWSLADLTLDGNKANQSSGTSYCLRVYGYGYMIRNTRFRNGYTGGILADWNGGNTSPGQDQVEAEWTDVKIHDNNGIGLELGGPHDSQFENISIFANGTHGLHIAPNAQYCMWTNMRVYGIAQGVSAVAILAEAISNLFVNCTAQDSDTVNLVLLANEIQWLGRVIGGTGSASATGLQIGQAAGNTPYSGMINQSAGVTTAITPLGCYIQGIFTSNLGTNGQIWLANDGGNNNIRVNCQQASGSTVTGTQATSTQLQVAMNGLTADGTLAKGGWYRLAINANKALTVSDRTNDVLNVNATNKRVELVNNTLLRIYSDSGYTTRTVELSNGTISVLQSASSAAIANGNTITTSGVGVARVNPGANVTGIVLQAGTLSGQECWVINESAFTVTFAAASSNVADGNASAIAATTARLFVWNSAVSLWFRAA